MLEESIKELEQEEEERKKEESTAASDAPEVTGRRRHKQSACTGSGAWLGGEGQQNPAHPAGNLGRESMC